MTDDLDTDPQDDPRDTEPVGIPRKDLKALRERSRRVDEAEQRAAAAERRLAFAEAGISLSDPKLTYFVKGYDGDLTPDAIRQAAEEAGFIEAAGQKGGGPNADELDAMRRLEAAATGAQVLPPDREAERNARLREARTEAEFDRIYAETGGAFAQ